MSHLLGFIGPHGGHGKAPLDVVCPRMWVAGLDALNAQLAQSTQAVGNAAVNLKTWVAPRAFLFFP